MSSGDSSTRRPSRRSVAQPTHLEQDIVRSLDQLCAVTDEQVAAAVAAAADAPGNDHHILPLIERHPARDERAALLGRLDHHDGVGQPADEPIPPRKRPACGGVAGAYSETTAPDARIRRPDSRCSGGYRRPRPDPSTAMVRPWLPARPVRGGVDAARQAAHHDHPGTRQTIGERRADSSPSRVAAREPTMAMAGSSIGGRCRGIAAHPECARADRECR